MNTRVGMKEPGCVRLYTTLESPVTSESPISMFHGTPFG